MRSPFGGGGPRGPQPAQDTVKDIDLDLADLFTGKVVPVRYSRSVNCSTCSGSGSKIPGGKTTCPVCDGRGMKTEARRVGPGFIQHTSAPCTSCNSTGTFIAPQNRCESCHGKAIKSEVTTLDVSIPAGAFPGFAMVFQGKGDEMQGSKHASSLVVRVRARPHRLFKRCGPDARNLLYTCEIDLAQALTGARVDITQLDGRVLHCTVPTGQIVNPDRTYTLFGEGFPILDRSGVLTGRRGNLYIKFIVKYPKTVSKDQALAIRKAFGLPAEDPKRGGVELPLTAQTVDDKELRSVDREDPRDSRGGPEGMGEEMFQRFIHEQQGGMGGGPFGGMGGGMGGGQQQAQCRQA